MKKDRQLYTISFIEYPNHYDVFVKWVTTIKTYRMGFNHPKESYSIDTKSFKHYKSNDAKKIQSFFDFCESNCIYNNKSFIQHYRFTEKVYYVSE